jgi:putative transposase
MPKGLVRYQQCGCFHFVTFGCYHRLRHLGTAAACELFERSLETVRVRYDFVVSGYVVMPDHVHLLVSEPKEALLSKALQALKLSVSVQSTERPFWPARYYDFNVHNEEKRVEKLRYMHRNPVKSGLVEKPEGGLGRAFGTMRSAQLVRSRSSRSGPRRGEMGSNPGVLPRQTSSTLSGALIDPRSQNRDLGHPTVRGTGGEVGSGTGLFFYGFVAPECYAA